MLRKTAAIAVLILIVSSFALGSVGRVQTVYSTGTAQGAVENIAMAGDRADVPPPIVVAGTWHSHDAAGSDSLSSGPDTVPVGQRAVAFVTMAGGQMISGVYNDERPLELPDENVSIVFYMNELRLERPAFESYGFVSAGNGTSNAAMFVIPARLPDRPDFDNLTINGSMAMIGPGADPQFYPFEWHKVPESGKAGNGTFARFAGHMTLPERNFSTDKTAKPTVIYRSTANVGVIEINSDMVVDMTTLQPVPAASRENATSDYDNHIAAGDTSWHVASVGSSIKSLNVDLKWSNPDGKLRLVIYTPDGKVLGPYYDDADGKTDGRINLNIANANGVAPGDWHMKVTDTDTLGDTDYYVKTY